MPWVYLLFKTICSSLCGDATGSFRVGLQRPLCPLHCVVSATLRSLPSGTCILRHTPKVKDYTFVFCLQNHTNFNPCPVVKLHNEGTFSSVSSAPSPIPGFCLGGNNSCWCLSQRKVAETGMSHVWIESREGGPSVQVAFSWCVSSCE